MGDSNTAKRAHHEEEDEDDNDDDSVAPFEKMDSYGEHRRAVSSVAMAPSRITSRRMCVSASADGTAKLWDMDYTNKGTGGGASLSPLSTFIGHSRGINDVAWSPTSEYIATASDDKTCRLWNVTTAQAVVEFRGHSNFCFAVTFNPSSNLLATGSFDETLKLWDARSGECISTIPAHSDPVTSVDFNRDGTCVVSGSHDGLVRIWDVATGECLKTSYCPTNESSRVSCPIQSQWQSCLGGNVGFQSASVATKYGRWHYGVLQNVCLEPIFGQLQILFGK